MRRLLGSALATTTAGLFALVWAPAAAADPLPFLAVDCDQRVYAFKGQPVVLSRVAVSGLVAKAVHDTPGLGGLNATSIALSFPLAPAIEVGAVPDGEGAVDGAAIADAVAAVVAPMPEVADAPEAAVAAVRELVSSSCGMTVTALDAGDEPTDPEVPAPPDPGTQQPEIPAPPPQQTPVPPNASPVLPDPSRPDRAAPRDYGRIPAADPGRYAPAPDARYGVPGYSPEFGLVGQDGSPVPDPATAGVAQALPTREGRVELPVVLAVLALSALTGALVRTWALRGA